jgi:uncharacterized protein (TIGR03435 family)
MNTIPIRVIALVPLAASLVAGAQAGTPVRPTFEVAAVKPSVNGDQSPQERRIGWGYETGRVTLMHQTVKGVISKVFDVQFYQIVCPDWIATEYFDIFANAPRGAPKEQIPLMFQALLEDKFNMRWHRESQTSPVYALSVAEGGPKLKQGLPGDSDISVAADTTGSAGARTSTVEIKGGEFGNVRTTLLPGLGTHYDYANITMVGLAHMLSTGHMLDLPVVDTTGLPGVYQVSLDIRPPFQFPRPGPALGPADAAGASDLEGESIRASLQKLGLRLVPRKLPVEKLVIDHIDKKPAQD